jgi:hypothetical protein
MDAKKRTLFFASSVILINSLTLLLPSGACGGYVCSPHNPCVVDSTCANIPQEEREAYCVAYNPNPSACCVRTPVDCLDEFVPQAGCNPVTDALIQCRYLKFTCP